MKRLKDEILADHKAHDYRPAYQMPLMDRVDASKDRQAEYKLTAQQLTDDDTFPYEVVCWIRGNQIE